MTLPVAEPVPTETVIDAPCETVFCIVLAALLTEAVLPGFPAPPEVAPVPFAPPVPAAPAVPLAPLLPAFPG